MLQSLVVAEVKLLHLFDIPMQARTRADDAKQQKRGAHSLFYGCCLARCLSQCAASSPPKDVGVQISKRRPGRSPPAPGGRVRRRESRRFGVFGRGRAVSGAISADAGVGRGSEGGSGADGGRARGRGRAPDVLVGSRLEQERDRLPPQHRRPLLFWVYA